MSHLEDYVMAAATALAVYLGVFQHNVELAAASLGIGAFIKAVKDIRDSRKVNLGA